MTAIACEHAEVILRVEDVSVTLGGKPILKDLNLEIRDVHRAGVTQGQVVGLLGPSGVGKTTLFRILAGLDKPDTGRVLVETELKPVQRGMVGVVAQNYPLFNHRSVLGNLIVAGKQARLSNKECKAKAKEMLVQFNLEEHENKYPVQLSGGQRQRVAIAQQFMCSEHFILMDEPFSGLDLVAQKKVSGFIENLAMTDELKTFILVTHDISAAVQVCDTLWIMGRDRDEAGNVIPGAKIQKTYDLAELGLAWQGDIVNQAEYINLMHEIRSIFPSL